MKVLDHGYIRCVEHWGSDERVIESARMSTGKGFLGWEPTICPSCNGLGVCSSCDGKGKTRGDMTLLKYLWDNHHATPFEMAGMVVEVQAPIMVFREWHRHRTQSYNEMSARYTPLPNVNYVPTVERLLMDSKTNKQAGTITGSTKLTIDAAIRFKDDLRKVYQEQENLYQNALNSGVPKELARVHLPVGRYSRMRASANLRNWLGFLTLRTAPQAQWEIRQYALAIGAMIRERFPRTWHLFEGNK